MTPQQITHILRRESRKRGYNTLEDFATDCGIGAFTMYKWEHGTNPNLQTLNIVLDKLCLELAIRRKNEPT